MEVDMKKRPIGLVAVSFLLISGCSLWWMISDPTYSNLDGTWLVDLTTRPAGWNDTKYVFNDDKTFEIYYDTVLEFKGNVTSTNDVSIDLTPIYSASGSALTPMTMCYVLANHNTTMKLGWYSGQTPVYYLDFTKQ
jgi:hypothetical protein